ncbi:hypothetical protein DL770_009998 [Monosporascus sp. CRB-9-2]|nr:hypothetical protein DL770_009998 [Monosporascus sp. CRB-9-2]
MASITLPAGLPETVKTILQPDIRTTKLILTETPFPRPLDPDDVLVRVHATAPCNGELMWAQMEPELIPDNKLPVPCQDLAGTVVSAQLDSGFAVGDDVFCRIDATRPGAGREYTIAKKRELARKPKSLSWVDAAATPLSSLTAWQALFVHGTLDAAGIHGDAAAREQNGKQRVLITGAGGSVGGWAVQLAALAGAGVVVAVCGPDKEATVKQLGATETLNYRETSVREWATADAGRQVDLVVDCIGGETLAGCWIAVKEGGAMISVNTPPDMVKPAGLNKNLAESLFFIVDPYGKNLKEIATLIEAGKVKALVDSVWGMNDFQKAFERLQEGHAKGKIIIKISPEA